MRQTNVQILISILLCVGFIKTAKAQTAPIPAAQEQMVKREISRQGVDEATLRALLLEKGINVDNMSPEEFLRARPQIEATVAEIKTNQRTARLENKADEAANVVVKKGLDEAQELLELVEEGATVSEAKAKISKELGKQNDIKPNIYGHKIFENKSLEVYRANERATAPKTYVLDTGDELAISIFGASQIDLLLEIGVDGFIKPSGVPRIYLKGRTLSEARELVRSRLSNYFVFERGQFSLTIDASRTISVGIYGEIRQSGTFTLSALNGPLNALIAAGGVTEKGSVRNIELIREGKRTIIDVYDFLQNPSSVTTIDLRDKDIINVPLAYDLVSISGGVRRPMTYELKSNETLANLLKYAGGTTSKAAVNTTRVERYSDGIVKILDVDQRNFSQLKLKNGDRVEIPIVSKPIENFVFISGEVLVDGKYGFRENLNLSQVINRAGLKPSARKDVAFIQRKNDDGTNRLIRVSITEASEDLTKELKRGDVITILASSRFIDNANFTVIGAIRDKEITLPYPLDGKISLEEAILLGGGLENNALSEALIIRTPSSNLEERNYIRINLSEAKSFTIEPFDQVVIYTQERFSDSRTVSISGAVRTPTTTTYDQSLGINDLLYLAGGLQFDAAHDRVEIYRLNLENNETKTLVESLSISDNGLIDGDFKLQPFDLVKVRSIAEYAPIESVYLNGEIRYPGSYARINGKNKISDFIKQAGGITDDAFPEGSTLERDGKKVIVEIHKILSSPLYPGNITLRHGDKLDIPLKRETVKIMIGNTYATEFGESDLTSEGNIVIAYQGAHKANWYINRYAGGLTNNAKKKAITVTGPAGDIQETTNFLGIKKYPTVKAGSIVYIPKKEPKKEKGDRERASWSEISQVIVAAMTTVATLIIISSRTN